MKWTLALVLIASVAHADTPLEARVQALEAKVKKLEAENARYAEALDFLEKVYQQQKVQQAQHDRDEPAHEAMFAVPIARDLANGQVAGDAGAAVTVVWAFDLADPYSARMVSVFDDLLVQYKGKLRVVFKHRIVHPQVATAAHHALCAAGKQKKFGEMWHAYWKNGYGVYTTTRDAKTIDAGAVVAIARDAGLDVRRFEADMASPACDAQIKGDEDELDKFKVNATPTFFINGAEISGAMPKEQFVQTIDDKLAEATKSGVAASKYYDTVIMVKGEKKFRSKVDPK